MKLNKLCQPLSIAILLVLIMTATSCKKFLDVNSSSSSYNTPLDVFTTPNGANDALIGVYEDLAGDYGYGTRLSIYFTCDNDEMEGSASTPYPDNDRRSIWHYDVTSQNPNIQKTYAQLYEGIERANLAIYYIPQTALYQAGNASMKQYLGEAYALRAQFYFDLVKIWGDVPFFNLPHIPATNLPSSVGATMREAIYDTILNDLHRIDSSALLPWTNSTNERFSMVAAKALRARIALFRTGYYASSGQFGSGSAGQLYRFPNYTNYYNIVVSECSDIMNGNYANGNMHGAPPSLSANFRSIFQNEICGHANISPSEILLQVGMCETGSGTPGDGSTNSKLGYFNGARIYEDFNLSVSLSSGYWTSLPPLYYLFDPSDSIRRDVTISIPYRRLAAKNATSFSGSVDTVLSTATTKMTDGKYRKYWTTASVNSEYTAINWPLIRYSDVILMHAEAENELGNYSAAITDLQMLYTGRGLSTSLIPNTNQSGLREFIRDERSREFAGEGIRKYDLFRWGTDVPAGVAPLGITPTTYFQYKLNLVKARMDSMANNKQITISATGTLVTIPSHVYWNRNGNGQVNWLNSFYAATPSPTPSGSIGNSNWATGSIATGSLMQYLALNFDYTTSKNFLMPFPAEEIILSNGLLKQNFGY